MSRLLTLLFASYLLISGTSVAAEQGYEQLMTELATAESAQQADQLTEKIWQHWLTAPDEAAQEVLNNALTRRGNRDFFGAISHLNRLVEGWPDYAEGWNQRATMYYLIGDLDASLADVARVLSLEPRHFGALSGKAVILYSQGKISLAQVTVIEALKYHPFLKERAILQVQPGQEL